jgi:hypothetical protein
MRNKELKARIEGDAYVVDPQLVAAAMLRRAAILRMPVPVITRRGARARAGAGPRPCRRA